jgi:muconolactone delta-isomerase
MIEERHFRLLDDENPLHFMTRWTAKTFLAKFKLMEHYATFSSPDKPPNDVQLDYFNRLAMNVIECDTRIFTTPMIKGFTWFMMLYYPFPAYVQLLQDLKKRPCSVHADRAWQVLSENALARSTLGSGRDNAVFRIQAALVTQAWDARVAAMGPRRPTVADVPRLVSYIKEQIERFRQETEAKRAAGEAQMNEASPSVGHQASSALFELNSQAELEDMMYWGLPVNSFQSSWTSNMSMHNVEGYAVSSNPTPQQLLDGFGI